MGGIVILYYLVIAHEEIGAQIERLQLVEWTRFGFAGVIFASNYGEVLKKMPRSHPCIVLMQVRMGEEYCFSTLEVLERQGVHASYILIEQGEEIGGLLRRMQDGDCSILFFWRDAALFNFLAGRLSLPKKGAVLAEENGSDPVLRRPLSEFSSPVAAVIEAVWEGYGDYLTLAGVAEHLHYNSKYLGRLFRNETHMKFSEYLLACRMRCAKDLLENTTEKVDYIAHSVGFQLTNNFYSYFKIFYGVSPNDFRRRRSADKTDTSESTD